jgi:queuosine precursor transporter
MILILMYLAAIVAANLSIAAFGPAAAPFNAFLFIGLDITARDGLHERWRGRGLGVRMVALVGAGSALSWVIAPAAGRIALASFVAFAAAGLIDALVYHYLRHRPLWAKVNASNVVSAGVDSVVFPTIAFGALLPVVIVAQFVAKVVGGAVWLWVLENTIWRSQTQDPRPDAL